LGNVTVRGEKDGKSKGGARWPSLNLYSITENIYYSQLSSVAILLQTKHVFTSYNTVQGNNCVLSPYVLSPCALPLPPTCLLVTANEALSYFASTIYTHRRSQWPRSLWRRSAVAWLLGSRVRIPLGAWMFVVLPCVGRGLCDGLITRPEESYRVSVCV
jgi:hypothetical protein